jgi:hypothetical protein
MNRLFQYIKNLYISNKKILLFFFLSVTLSYIPILVYFKQQQCIYTNIKSSNYDLNDCHSVYSTELYSIDVVGFSNNITVSFQNKDTKQKFLSYLEILKNVPNDYYELLSNIDGIRNVYSEFMNIIYYDDVTLLADDNPYYYGVCDHFTLESKDASYCVDCPYIGGNQCVAYGSVKPVSNFNTTISYTLFNDENKPILSTSIFNFVLSYKESYDVQYVCKECFSFFPSRFILYFIPIYFIIFLLYTLFFYVKKIRVFC